MSSGHAASDDPNCAKRDVADSVGADSAGTGSVGADSAAADSVGADSPESTTQGYSASRRTPRRHRRVVRHGTERFDADGVKLEPGDMRTEQQRDADDDLRILGELPPHWAVFNEHR